MPSSGAVNSSTPEPDLTVCALGGTNSLYRDPASQFSNGSFGSELHAPSAPTPNTTRNAVTIRAKLFMLILRRRTAAHVSFETVHRSMATAAESHYWTKVPSAA